MAGERGLLSSDRRVPHSTASSPQAVRPCALPPGAGPHKQKESGGRPCLGVEQQRRVRLEGALWGGVGPRPPGPLHRRPAQGEASQEVEDDVALPHAAPGSCQRGRHTAWCAASPAPWVAPGHGCQGRQGGQGDWTARRRGAVRRDTGNGAHGDTSGWFGGGTDRCMCQRGCASLSMQACHGTAPAGVHAACWAAWSAPAA